MFLIDQFQVNVIICKFLETLRKHSPVARIDRCCVKDYKIRGTDIVMEKGMNVSVPVVGFHYDPTYFPNPEKFDPLRFQENRNPDGFLSFGIGPRNCIGNLNYFC